MRFEGPDRWVELWIEANDRVVRYRDDRGTVVRSGDGRRSQVAIEELLRQSLALPGMHESLAVFVRAEPELFRNRSPQTVVQRIFPTLPPGWQAVRSFPRPSRRHEPFELPLHITTVGDAGANSLSRFLQHGFVSTATGAGTVVIDSYTGPVFPPLHPSRDVLIASAKDAEAALRRMPRPYRPRLVIALGTDSARLAEAEELLRDSAFIGLPMTSDPAGVIDDILLSIVHDEPVHLWDIVTRNDAVVIADPRTNQSLRMSDAFAAEARRDLEVSIGARPLRKRPLASNQVFTIGIGAPQRRPLDLIFQFDRESNGLIPLTHAIASSQFSMFDGAVPASHGPEPERRRVDARVERVESVPPIDRWMEAAKALWVGENRTLQRGARYRLRVQIGRTVPGNLVPASTPDLVLPPTPYDQWTLDVVVFNKDFALCGASQQRLILPKRGASDPVYFDVIAPETGDTAELRFAIYLDNQILQSFRLDALLDTQESERSGGLRVELDLAKSSAFSNLDSLGPRALSIGINDDAAAGKHSLLMKIGDANEGVTLTAQELDGPVAELRLALDTASIAGPVPRFPARDLPLTAAQRQAFETTIRQLAGIGSRLHDALFIRCSKPMKARLREVMKVSGKTLQFPRFAPNFSVPWRIVYDFAMPDDPQAALICDGTIGGAQCSHGPESDAICINGFWGIRHAIEEHLALAVGDARRTITSTAGRPKARAADGAADGYCEAMIAELEKEKSVGKGVVTRVDAGEHIFDDILWKDRPPLMMFVGHLDPNLGIRLPGKPEWLKAEQITKRAKLADDDWAQPYSIILLMACDAMNMDASTLNGHALALTAAGAAAVVGPECRISSAFACRVAEDLIVALLKQGHTLGAALSEFRRHLVRTGNPLGFAFTAFGDADVAIV